MMVDAADTGLLHRAVAANAVFSMTSGATLAVLARLLGAFAGVAVWLVLVVGLGVFTFGASLAVRLRRSGISRRLAQLALVADVGWVAAAVAVVVSPTAISSGGRWLLGVITLVVCGLGIAEWVGLRRPAS